jgi:hypothetical protein
VHFHVNFIYIKKGVCLVTTLEPLQIVGPSLFESPQQENVHVYHLTHFEPMDFF